MPFKTINKENQKPGGGGAKSPEGRGVDISLPPPHTVRVCIDFHYFSDNGVGNRIPIMFRGHTDSVNF